MSNIIDGHDIGMGYETVKERCGGIQALHGGRWINLAPIPGIGLNPEGHYRRPLPIISQHPGAIPLEPGEELKVGERYLMRNGIEVNDLRFNCSLFTYSIYYASVGCGWSKYGSSVASQHPFDIIARLPKVDQKGEKKRENLIDIGATMSNIIDGHDIGMGYEKTTSTLDKGVQWFCPSTKAWEDVPVSSPKPAFGLLRRPLPIISQHPGAIPLEPGDELIEGECYLMRDGRLTGPMPYDGHEAFPFGLDGTPDTWRRDGSCWKNSLSRNDIIARLPKVDQKAPEKAKEEKVAIESYSLEHKSTLNAAITLSEAARIAQLPEVIAEVERQRKDMEIKVGDWFRHRRGAVDKCLSASELSMLTDSGGKYQRKNCAKITNPDFIALLERGS